jgi:hypothetical protein
MMNLDRDIYLYQIEKRVEPQAELQTTRAKLVSKDDVKKMSERPCSN